LTQIALANQQASSRNEATVADAGSVRHVTDAASIGLNFPPAVSGD